MAPTLFSSSLPSGGRGFGTPRGRLLLGPFPQRRVHPSLADPVREAPSSGNARRPTPGSDEPSAVPRRSVLSRLLGWRGWCVLEDGLSLSPARRRCSFTRFVGASHLLLVPFGQRSCTVIALKTPRVGFDTAPDPRGSPTVRDSAERGETGKGRVAGPGPMDLPSASPSTAAPAPREPVAEP